MSSRDVINKVQQLAVEVTPGTPVAAVRRLAGLQYKIGDTLETKQARRYGAKADTVSAIHKKWAQGSFSGPICYDEIVYVLAGLLPYSLSAVGVNGEYTWQFTPNSAGQDTPKHYTLEQGDDVGGEKYSYLVHASADFNFSRDDVNCSGNVFAYPSAAGALNAVGVEDLFGRIVQASEIDVYMDDTFAGIGTTKITDAFDAKVSIGEKFKPKWVMNTSVSSFKEPVEVIPPMTLAVTTEHNAQSIALKAALAANTPKFFRIQAKGPLIGGAVYYLIQIDFCGMVNQYADDEPQDVWGYQYTFSGLQEATMGRAWSVKVINKLGGLMPA